MSHIVMFAALAIASPDASPFAQSAQQESHHKPEPVTSTPLTVNSPSEATATVSPITAAATVEPQEPDRIVELSLGTSIAAGKFGSISKTSLWSTALGARVTWRDLRISASIPYMRVRSNGLIFTGIDSTPVVIASGTGHKRTNDGFGDVTLGSSYILPHRVGDIEVELAARTKVPTASRSSRLSSGKVDYSLGIQATKAIGRVAPFISVTYRILGDTREFNLHNGFAASVGTSFIMNSRTVLLGSYHYSRSASNFIHDGHELFLGGSREIEGDRLRLTAFATLGLSSGAAATSGGFAVSVAL